MGYLKRIDRAFYDAITIPLTPSSRIVFISDCHRGTGNTNDNFLPNKPIYLAAIQSYYHSGFTYIELGDGDELWENRNLSTIQQTHANVFQWLKRFHKDNRLYLLYGNHDLEKKQTSSQGDFVHYSGILLKDSQTDKTIYLTHGHQSELLNSTLWKLARFLVRYLWKPLELYGIVNPTSTATNHKPIQKAEQRLNRWAKERNGILITGHTHRAMTGTHENPYFNSGCCIYPDGITALELVNRQFTLVKWTLDVRSDRSLYVARTTLSPPVSLDIL